MGTALAQFVVALGGETPADAMRRACDRLRQRVRAAGWTAGLDAYVRAFGLRVEEGPIPTAGRLDQEGGRYVVRVQRTRHRGEPSDAHGGRPAPPIPLRIADATPRQRFTIAHEIGHALLLESLGDRPEALTALRDPDPAAWAEIEALCDAAAGELLVPLDELTALAGQLGISLRGLERLADRFRVAQDIVEARLLAAGAVSLSLWRVSVSPGDDRGGRLRTRFERTLAPAGGHQPRSLPILRASTWLIPDIVQEAALAGRVAHACVAVKSGEASWLLAAVAACHQPLGTRAEQPSLLDAPPLPDTRSAPGASTGEAPVVAPEADALVTLLLLPTHAAEAGAPLWTALTTR